jgi:hypothetical protein
MEAQLGHCSLASKDAGISFWISLAEEAGEGLRGRRVRRLLGTTPSISRASLTVIEANLLFQPAVQEEEAELMREIMSSDRAGALSLAERGGMAAHAAETRARSEKRRTKRIFSDDADYSTQCNTATRAFFRHGLSSAAQRRTAATAALRVAACGAAGGGGFPNQISVV